MGAFRRSSLLLLSIKQFRTARAPQKVLPPSLNRAAPRSGSTPQKQPFLFLYQAEPRRSSLPKQLPPSFSRAAQRSGSTPQKQPLPSLKSQSSRPAQWEIPQSSLLPPFTEWFLAAGALPMAPRSRSTPQKQPLLSHYQAEPRSGSSLPKQLIPPSFSRAAQHSGSTPSLNQVARAVRCPPKQPPRSHPLIEQPRAAGASSQSSFLPPPSIEASSRHALREAAPHRSSFSFSQSSSPAQYLGLGFSDRHLEIGLP